MSKLGFLLRMGATTFFLILWVNPSYAEIVLEDAFDKHEDWHSGLLENDTPENIGRPDRGQHSFNGAILPDGWFSIRQEPIWSPTKGYAGNHEMIEVLESNVDKARGGRGKSFVKWRDSQTLTGGAWSSDGLAMFYLPDKPGVPEDGLNEVYVEFYITFSNESIASYYADAFGSGKLFRILHWAGDRDQIYAYFNEDQVPALGWQAGASSIQYGIRNFLSFLTKGDKLDSSQVVGIPTGAQLVNGSVSLPYSSPFMQSMGVGGTDTMLEDKKNGGLITSGPVALDQVYGDETTWTKIGFYVKLNSAPGVYDGVAMQWIDDKRTFVNETIAWIQPGYPMAKWNSVLLGGNDHFSARPNEEHYQEWYAIDDLVVRDDIPAYLKVDQLSPPKPPLINVN